MRIKDLPTGTQASTDYIAVDNDTDGARRIILGDSKLNINAPTYANGILDYAVNVAPLGMSIVSPRNMGYADLPSQTNMYGTAIILKRGTNAISVTIITDSNQYETITNYYSSSAWHGWKYTTGAYCALKDKWDSLLSKAEPHIGVTFSLNGATTNAVFDIGASYFTNGVVALNSSTSATGFFTYGVDQYTFEYNPSTGTLTSINRLVKKSEVALLKYLGSVTSNNPITINISGTTMFLMHLFGSTAGRTGTYNVWTTASTNYAFPIGTAPSAITVDTTTGGKIKLTNSGTSNCHVYLQIFEGSSYVSV